MLLPMADQLSAQSPASPITVGIGAAAVLYNPAEVSTGGPAGGVAYQASQQVNGIWVAGDSTLPVFILLGPGTPSATNYHFILPANSLVPVLAGGANGGLVWRGEVQAFNSGASAAKIGVIIL